MKKITSEQAIGLDKFYGDLNDSHYYFERNHRGNFDIFEKDTKLRITSWSERLVFNDKGFTYYLEKNNNTINY